jgi:acyl-coenzyme A thioesterase PaaI-like protein
MAKHVDRLKQLIEGTIPSPPVARLIGFQLTAFKPGEAVVELQTDERHANPMGTVHGGVIADIAGGGGILHDR